MNAAEIRQKYLDFFQKKPRSHKLVTAASLVPYDDPTTLFTSSGMQQLIPYLKGQPHPMGKRLVNSQPCFRAEDIDEVGDNRHTTFFEMLGNWSLGDYFKQEQLAWFWEFLLKQLNLPPGQLYISVFKGHQDIPRDDASARIWQKLGVPKNRIFYYGVKQNWWSRSGPPDLMPPGEIGGPDSEVFFEFKQLKHDSKFGKDCHPNCQCGRFLEIGNSVFIQYEKQPNGSFKPLPQKNVDFGGGLERLAAAVQGTPDMFQIDIIAPVIKEIEKSCEKKYENDNKAPMRVIADHLRAATFMIAQDIEPSNKTQGYILRRLLRRSAVKMHELGGGLTPTTFSGICHEVIRQYPGFFNTTIVRNKVSNTTDQEMDKFAHSLDKGLREVKKFDPKVHVDANLFAFNLYQTYGFPFEISKELIEKKGGKLNKDKFDTIFETHKKLSRTASTGMFKGGLKDQSAASVKLHTATHLIHQALRQVLGDQVHQQGSHITPERLRFDFTHDQPLADDQIKEIETIVNQQIKKDLQVTKTIQSKDKALKSGALAFFQQSYSDQVTVYSIGDFSKELCGGPHVTSTGKIGGVRIIKQQSIGASKRRLYAVLSNGTKKSTH